MIQNYNNRFARKAIMYIVFQYYKVCNINNQIDKNYGLEQSKGKISKLQRRKSSI